MITIPISLHNGLSENAILDTNNLEEIRRHFQEAYDQAFCQFMEQCPVCPHCQQPLYRHDSCSRRVKMPFLEILLNLTLRRVRCPHCGRTHRVLPSFIIPGFQICSQTAAEIIQLHNAGKSVFSHSDPLVDSSSAYRFLKKLKTRFSAVISLLRSFGDLFTCSAVKAGSYITIQPRFSHFSIFQPVL